ncbi:MAG: site-specific integrase [Candidatus Marsarchaeota archaeon]|nr:site-specific integrase [Candidatus Marsarchaeota archaeon]
MAGRRGNGEGSIYQRASDGRWLGAITLGYDANGKLRRKVVTAKTRGDVVQALKKLQRQVDDGLPAPDTTLTISQLLTSWHDDILRHQVAPSAASNYKAIADHHIIPALGRKKVASLLPGDIDRLISEKMDSGLSVSTVRRIRSVLAQALDQGVRWGSVTRNVASLTRPPKAARKEGRTLTPEQARHLLHTLKGHRNETLYALMLSTGLRRGEALGLRWDDFNAKEGTVSIRRQLTRENGSLSTKDTKTARSRRSINRPLRVVENLKAHKARQARERLELGPAWQDTGYIFTSSVGTPLDPRNLNREFKTVCQKAGLGDWHPHELRHSAASLMLAQGVKIQVVSEVLGHSSIRMTADVYGHILAPDREAAAAAMSETLWPK